MAAEFLTLEAKMRYDRAEYERRWGLSREPYCVSDSLRLLNWAGMSRDPRGTLYDQLPEPTCPHCGQLVREGEWHNNTFRSLDGTESEIMCGLPDGRPGPGLSQPKDTDNE